MLVGNVLEHARVINRRAVVGDFHVAPSLERREGHKEVRHTIALVFIIDAPRMALRHRNGSARFLDQLLARLVEANQRKGCVTGTFIDGQNIFHRRHERGVGLRCDHPLLLAMRFENVFLRTRPIVLSLAAGTMLSSTTFCSSKRNDQRA